MTLYCPMKFAAAADADGEHRTNQAQCEEHECAWWSVNRYGDPGRCAFLAIATQLRDATTEVLVSGNIECFKA